MVVSVYLTIMPVTRNTKKVDYEQLHLRGRTMSNADEVEIHAGELSDEISNAEVEGRMAELDLADQHAFPQLEAPAAQYLFVPPTPQAEFVPTSQLQPPMQVQPPLAQLVPPPPPQQAISYLAPPPPPPPPASRSTGRAHEDEINKLRDIIQGQEDRLRESLLYEELCKLRATYEKNEALLRSRHEAAMAASPAPVYSVLPTVPTLPPLPSLPYPGYSAPANGAANVFHPRVTASTVNAQSTRQQASSVRRSTRAPTTTYAPAATTGEAMAYENELFLRNPVHNRNVTELNDNKSANGNYAMGNSITHSNTCTPQRNPSLHTEGTSGYLGSASDHVKLSQTWAHAALPADCNTNSSVSFSDLDFRRLIAGEMEILLEHRPNNAEAEGRLNLIRMLAHLLGAYPWAAVRGVYAAVLRKIEQGQLSWSSDFHQTMHFSLLTTTGPVRSDTAAGDARAPTSSGRRRAGLSNPVSDNAKIWFCSEFQKNSCAHKEAHQKELYGKIVTVHHICAKCLLKDRREVKHPESSLACPHYSA